MTLWLRVSGTVQASIGNGIVGGKKLRTDKGRGVGGILRKKIVSSAVVKSRTSDKFIPYGIQVHHNHPQKLADIIRYYTLGNASKTNFFYPHRK